MTKPPKKLQISVLSWNVNGLGDKLKRGLVLQYIHRHRPDIVLLQETHMLGNTCKALDRKGYKMVAHTSHTTGSRGVGILLRKSFPFLIQEIWQEGDGRLVGLTGRWEEETINIISAYTPPPAYTLRPYQIWANCC